MFFLIEKARMQKEKAIKFILRKLLEIYFENLLTFFKICGDPNFKYIRRSPKNETYSLRV